jgi:N-acetylglucosaminyl-diphospho-decaprenol L-rhamnosyltransferase
VSDAVLKPHPVDVSIIIVSWNVENMLAECLASIYQNAYLENRPPRNPLEIEVIVVDSASTDGTVDMVQTRFRQVRLLAQNTNVGYTRGNNIGMAAATGRHLLLLNPDTIILGNALAEMVHYLDKHPDVGIVGPFTLNTDGTQQSTRRRFPTVKLAYFESTWLEPFASNYMLDQYYMNDVPRTGTMDVDWVQGSALMLRRAVYEQIGGLDERYVMFSEEMDFCKRAKDAGWRVVFVGTAQIIHHGGKSTEQVTANKHIYFQESKLRYFKKFHGAAVTTRLRWFLLANYAFQIAVETTKWLLGHKRPLRAERIRAYSNVLRDGLKVD